MDSKDFSSTIEISKLDWDLLRISFYNKPFYKKSEVTKEIRKYIIINFFSEKEINFRSVRKITESAKIKIKELFHLSKKSLGKIKEPLDTFNALKIDAVNEKLCQNKKNTEVSPIAVISALRISYQIGRSNICGYKKVGYPSYKI